MNTPLFDSIKAHDYLTSLSPPLLELPVGAEQLGGVQFQPTIGPQVAALLDVLIRSQKPSRILEIGASFGYAACIMGAAAASYGGTVTTMEIRGDLADAAKRNIERLGLTDTVRVIEGDAREWIETLRDPFGLILQDGHKELYEALLEPLIERLAEGGLLVSDDILFPVMAIPDTVRSWGEAIAHYNRRLCEHPRLRTSWLPIGDGVAVSVKIA